MKAKKLRKLSLPNMTVRVSFNITHKISITDKATDNKQTKTNKRNQKRTVAFGRPAMKLRKGLWGLRSVNSQILFALWPHATELCTYDIICDVLCSIPRLWQ